MPEPTLSDIIHTLNTGGGQAAYDAMHPSTSTNTGTPTPSPTGYSSGITTGTSGYSGYGGSTYQGPPQTVNIGGVQMTYNSATGQYNPTNPIYQKKTTAAPSVWTGDQANQDFQTKLADFNNISGNMQVQGANVAAKIAQGLQDPSVKAALANMIGIKNYSGTPDEENRLKTYADVATRRPDMSKKLQELIDYTGKVAGGKEGTPGAPVPPATTPPIVEKTESEKLADEQKSLYETVDKSYTDYQNKINDLNNGVFPLSSDEQALVDSTQKTIDRAKAAQLEANKATENTYRQAAFRSGSEYTPEVSSGLLKGVIDNGIQKISDLEVKGSELIATLKQGFKDKRYKAVNDAYTQLQDILKQKSDVLKTFYTQAREHEKDVLAYQEKLLAASQSEKSPIYKEWLNYNQEGGTLNFNDYMTMDANRKRSVTNIDVGGAGTGENVPLYTGLKGATATAVRSAVSGFKSEPTVANFVMIQDGHKFAQSMSNTTVNPADDQALIYSLAKVLDPGSVVREGEYNTANKYSQSWVDAYGKSVTHALAGTGFLSQAARTNIKKTIETKYKSSKSSYDNVHNQYVKSINNLTGRNDGDKFLRDYVVDTGATSDSGGSKNDDYLKSLGL